MKIIIGSINVMINDNWLNKCHKIAFLSSPANCSCPAKLQTDASKQINGKLENLIDRCILFSLIVQASIKHFSICEMTAYSLKQNHQIA